MRVYFKTGYDHDIRLFPDARQALRYAALVALAVVLPFLLDDFLIGEVTIVLIWAIAGMGLMVLTGHAGQPSLGHAAFLAAGCYANAILMGRFGFPFLASFALAGVLTGLVGVLIAVPALRLHGIYLVIATLALSILTEDIIVLAEPWTGGVAGMTAPAISIAGVEVDRLGSPDLFYWLCLAVALLVTLGYRNILRAPLGRAFAAVRDSEISAQAMGVNPARTKTAAFGLSCMTTGWAGALMGHFFYTFNHEAFTVVISIQLLLMIVIGGLGSIHGAYYGAVVVGSVSDLSGPFAAFGAPAVKAAQMHFKAVNASGGLHGRKIRFVVEDSSYQMPKALQAYNKLVNRDKVFAMLLSLGTPMNIAGFKLTTPKNIPSISPLTTARQMVSEPIRLRFSGARSYYDELRQAAHYMVKSHGVSKLCAMYIPTDFGKEMKAALVDEAGADAALDFVAETAHKPDEKNFVGSLQKLKAGGCQLVGLALAVSQTITVVATAKKLGLADLKFVGSSASFHTVIAKVPGGITEGLFASAAWSDLASRANRKEPAAFIAAYKKATGKFPGTSALLGYAGVVGFTMALEKAGRNLSVDSFLKAMESLNCYDPILDNRVSYSATDHRGADEIVFSVVKGGNWQELARFK